MAARRTPTFLAGSILSQLLSTPRPPRGSGSGPIQSGLDEDWDPLLRPIWIEHHDARRHGLLTKLDQLRIADNTIVMYSTDNGAEIFSWPDSSLLPLAEVRVVRAPRPLFPFS